MKLEKAYFGGGCFWCTEAVFQRLKGVEKVTSGYAGGDHPQPNYFKVSEGLTNHAEVIEVEFDPAVISYEQLLDVFFHTHNPTTLNQQGADIGTQYRSIILTISTNQATAAEKIKQELNEHEFDQAIVTEIRPLEKFFSAEEYHHDYFNRNQDSQYCQLVIDPKLATFRNRYKALLKDKSN